MAEVLEIQIQDKGGNAASATTPPRPPAPTAAAAALKTPAPAPVQPVAARPVPQTVAGQGGVASAMQPRASSAPAPRSTSAIQPAAPAKRESSWLERVLEHFGHGKQVQQFQSLFDWFSDKAKARKSETRAPAAARPEDSSALRGVVEQGFTRVEKQLDGIADAIADTPRPVPAAAPQTSAASAPAAAPRPAATSASAPPGLQHKLATPPTSAKGSVQAPAVPRLPPAPSAASTSQSPKPPAVAPRPPAVPSAGAAAPAAGEAAAAAEGMGEAVAGAGAALSAIAPPAAIAAAAFVAVGASIKMTKDAIDKLTDRAHELAGFSPTVLQAEVNRSIQSLYDDIREAQQIGPDLARMLDAETALQHDLRTILLPIKKAVANILADLMRGIAANIGEILSVLKAMAEGIASLLKFGADIATGDWKQSLIDVAIGVGKIISVLKDNKEDTPPDANFLADLYNAGTFEEEEQPAPDQNQFRPNIPLIQIMAGL